MPDVTITYHDARTMAVHFPGEKTKGHDVLIPLTLAGLTVLHGILEKRRHYTHHPALIGSAGAPVQYDVDQMLREFKKSQPEKPKPKPSGLPVFDLSSLGL